VFGFILLTLLSSKNLSNPHRLLDIATIRILEPEHGDVIPAGEEMRLVAVFRNLGTVDVESIPVICKIYNAGVESPLDSLLFQAGVWIPNLFWRGSERDSIIEQVVDFGNFKVPPSTINPSVGRWMRVEFRPSETWLDDNPNNDHLTVYVNVPCASKKEFFLTPPDSHNVRMVGKWSKGPCFSAVYKGDYLFTGAGKDLYLLDVSNPSKIAEMNKISTQGMIYGLSISGNYLYVANGENGMSIFDITDPTKPQKMGNCNTPGRAWKVRVNYPYAYVADLEGGLRIIDVSNPYSPQEVGYFDETDSLFTIWGVDVKDSYAYITGAFVDSFIVDISDPSHPSGIFFLSGWVSGWSYGQDIEIQGDYLYHIEGRGLSIFDISKPDSPKLMGGYPAPHWTWGLDVSGDTVFAADANFGLRVIDASEPKKPKEIGYYDTPGQAEDVCLSYPFIYVADGWQGLEILKCYKLGIRETLEKNSTPSLYLLPNPSTNIARIYYTLPESSSITLSLYDISGRRVKILDRGYKPTGFYSLSFNTKRFPKGVYFLSLKIKGRTSILKIILN